MFESIKPVGAGKMHVDQRNNLIYLSVDPMDGKLAAAFRFEDERDEYNDKYECMTPVEYREFQDSRIRVE